MNKFINTQRTLTLYPNKYQNQLNVISCAKDYKYNLVNQIKIDGCNLTWLPDLSKFTFITILDCSNNKLYLISHLPPAVSQLNCRNNLIKFIDVSYLKNLRALYSDCKVGFIGYQDLSNIEWTTLRQKLYIAQLDQQRKLDTDICIRTSIKRELGLLKWNQLSSQFDICGLSILLNNTKSKLTSAIKITFTNTQAQ